MPDAIPVLVPLLNPNEPEAMLVALHVHEGQIVRKGDLICTLETTKSTADLLAEVDGFVAGLKLTPGQTAQAGDLLCYLAPSPDWQAPIEPIPAPTTSITPSNLRITQPALMLAEKHKLDLSHLPEGELITERHVRELLDQSTRSALVLPDVPYDPAAIVIFGGGGHGKALIDLLGALGTYPIAGVLDDRLKPGDLIMGVQVLGGAAALGELRLRGLHLAVNAVGGIGNVSVRIRVFDQLTQAGFTCPPLIHPKAMIEPSAHLADGVQVFPNAYVGSASRLGYGVIVNTGAIVSHDCQIGDYTNLSPGSILAGEVQIGPAVLVGMGVTINLQVKIGERARIGNGATIKSDLPDGGIVRAGTTWPSDQPV